MYEIDRRFLNDDGSLNFDATELSCRKARARAAGSGFRCIKEAAGELIKRYLSASNGPTTVPPSSQQA